MTASAIVAAAMLASPASATSGAEAEFVRLVNGARAQAGLHALSVRSDLASVARRHSARMADSESIWHNPGLRDEVSNWRTVGENVGRGRNVKAIHDALMDSPTHRDNILLREFTEIGVGVVRGSDGRFYVTQVFRLPMRRSAPPPPAPPARAPAAVTPTIHVAPAPEAAPRTTSMLAQLLLLD